MILFFIAKEQEVGMIKYVTERQEENTYHHVTLLQVIGLLVKESNK